ncbi:MAG: hypothetical protein ACYTGR_15135 [Planctomycetota bacterium]
MHRRFLGLLRDAWYTALVILVAGVVFWIVMHPAVGIAAVLLGTITFAYFALMRYDDDGNERKSDGPIS